MKLIQSNFSRPSFTSLLAFLCLLAPIHVIGQAALDTSYTPNLSHGIYGLGIQADGKLLLGSALLSKPSGSAGTKMSRLNIDGSVDDSFDFAGNGVYYSYYDASDTFFSGYYTGVYSVSCFVDGTAALSGYFRSVQSPSQLYSVPKIFKVNEDGNAVTYKAPDVCNVFGTVRSYFYSVPYIVSLPNNQSFVYGDFNGMDSTVLRPGIGRLSSTGALITSFLPQPGFPSSSGTIFHDIRCALLQNDAKTIIAGSFLDFNGSPKTNLVRVTSSGALDSAFNPNPNSSCWCLALQADGKIIVAGNFTTIGGGSRTRIARLNTDGTLDTTFNVSVNNFVYSIQIRVDGKIIIAGTFTQVNDTNRGRYALINSDGSLAPEYSEHGANGPVYGLALQNDGKIILGGIYSSIGLEARANIARLVPDVSSTSTLTTDDDGTMIEWTRTGSAPELNNAEFRVRTTGTEFTTLLGEGRRTATGWKIDKLKLPGNKTFDIQAKGLSRGGLYNGSTSVMSATRTGLLRPLPLITSPPLAPQTVVVGDAGVSFSITATSAATITYQWSRNNVAIAGATTSTYTIPGGVTAAQAGTYRCTVTSTAGSVTTNPGSVLTVVTPITITKQPLFQAILPGKPAGFAVTVTGTSPQYQWFKGPLLTPVMIGTNLPTFKIPIVSSGDENDYWVEITNFAGTVISEKVKLWEVTAGATVDTPPANAIFAMGTNASLTAAVTSESTPVNQWLKNKVPVKGGTSIPLLIPAIKLTDAGKYTIKTTNPAGTQTSTQDGEIAVVDQSSLKKFVIAQGGTVAMTAIAAGNNLTYKWKKAGVGGAYITDTLSGVTPSVAGSATKTLTIKGLQTTNAADYTCEVTATPGGMLESATQTVAVTTGPPVIASTLDFPVGMVGDFYDYTVPMNGPAEITANKFSAKGLPAGLKIDSFSGRITGRPTLAKSVDVTYPVTITASNGSGNALLTKTANLIVRPITGGLALVGSYIAVITPSAPGTAFQHGGRIDLTTTVGGAYSGKLTLGATAISFTGGKLNVGLVGGADFNSRNSISILRPGLPTLTVAFDLNVATLLLENGQITDGTDTSPFSGWKNKWSATEKALAYKGYYTMALEAPAPVPGDLTYPLGDGYAAFTVGDLGTLTIAGKLADGTGLTMSTGFVGPTGQLAVYNFLYTTTGGSLWSDGVTITSVGTAPGYLESTVSGSLQWTKRPQTAGYTYAGGFGPLALNIIGGRYATTTTISNSNVLDTSVLANDTQLTYTGANVETADQDPNINVILTSRNAFVVPTLASGLNPAAVAISLAPTTGILTTSFVVFKDEDPGSDIKIVRRTAKGVGIVVRNLGTGKGQGYGHFTLLQSPGSTTSQILSGRLRITDDTP